MAGNAIKTRIQLKSDTEANWNSSVLVADGGTKQSGNSFIPLKGEIIIYSADDTHPFSRLKVGDGITNVVNLPFIDSGSTNNFVLREFQSEFPPYPNSNTLYYEVATNSIYNWDSENGYKIKYHPITTNINNISSWDSGKMTLINLDSNTATLNIINGVEPTLTYDTIAVLTSYGI